MIKHLLLLFLVCGAFQANAQKYAFDSYSTKEGLAQSQVTTILQDKDGYLWVGTLGGLAKFNGRTFKTFSTEDGLLNSRVSSLEYFEDAFWVGHDGGISVLRNDGVKTATFEQNQGYTVSKIVRFREHILVCTLGAGLYRLEGEKLLPVEIEIDLDDVDWEGREEEDDLNFSLNLPWISDAHVYNDRLYIASDAGIIETSDSKLKNFEYTSDPSREGFSGIVRSSRYFVEVSYEHGVYFKDLKNNTEDSLVIAEGIDLEGCYMFNETTIWLRSSSGAFYVDLESKKVTLLDESSGMPTGIITAVYEDSDQNIWFGSSGKGIFKFAGFSLAYYDKTSGLSSELMLSGIQSKNGNYYFGTWDRGLIQMDPVTGESSEVEIDESIIWAAQEDVDGKDWFGGQGALFAIDESGVVEGYRWDQVPSNTGQYRELAELPGRKITALLKVGKRSMYIGGAKGVTLYKNGVFTKLPLEKGLDEELLGTVRDMELVGDKLYCVSKYGLFVYDGKVISKVKGFEAEVFAVAQDNKGSLWCGAAEGLFHFYNGKIERVILSDKPSSNFINFVEYNDGKLYVGSNNSLFVLSDLGNKEPKILRIGQDAGLVDLETNINSAFFDKNGIFWFGTASGLVRLDPKLLRDNEPAIKLTLKNILLHFKSFDYADYSDGLTIDGLPTNLVLPHSQNNLLFELDAITMINHERLKYQFWLVGQNDDWSPLTDAASISFTGLSSGNYVLKIRAVDEAGRMSNVVEFPFLIKQAFYQTWWFIMLCSFFIASIVWVVFRIRLKRINERNEKEKLLLKTSLLSLEQKSVNASMNRHFIFNALNSIQYFINTQDRLSANKYLTNFAQLIRKNLDSATSETNTITLEEEISRLRLYLSLESMRFKDRFDYDIDTGGVDMESINIPAMILQPFVENSIIHGILPNEEKKGLIQVKLELINDYLNIIVEDNGIGVKQSMSRKTEMDGDHKSQGMEITSKRIELLRAVSQSEISLTGPEEVFNDDRSIKGTRVLLKIPLHNLEL